MVLDKDGVVQATDSGLYLCKEKAMDHAPNGSLIVGVDGEDNIPTSSLLKLDDTDNGPISPASLVKEMLPAMPYSVKYHSVQAMYHPLVSWPTVRTAYFKGLLFKFKDVYTGNPRKWLWKGYLQTAWVAQYTGSSTATMNIGYWDVPKNLTSMRASPSKYSGVSWGNWVDHDADGCNFAPLYENGRLNLWACQPYCSGAAEMWADAVPFVMQGTGDAPTW